MPNIIPTRPTFHTISMWGTRNRLSRGGCWASSLYSISSSKTLENRVHPKNPRARKIRPYFPGYLFFQLDLHQSRCSSLRHSLWSQDKPLPGCLIRSGSSLPVLSLLHLAAADPDHPPLVVVELVVEPVETLSRHSRRCPRQSTPGLTQTVGPSFFDFLLSID